MEIDSKHIYLAISSLILILSAIFANSLYKRVDNKIVEQEKRLLQLEEEACIKDSIILRLDSLSKLKTPKK